VVLSLVIFNRIIAIVTWGSDDTHAFLCEIKWGSFTGKGIIMIKAAGYRACGFSFWSFI
jgi:hypothetical protein